MNIKSETISKMKDLGYAIDAVDDCYMDTSFTKGNKLLISKWNDDGSIFSEAIKTPKQKEVTVEWILSKLDKESSYKNLSRYLRKIFDYSISIYPTSYGFGVDTFGGYKSTARKVSDKLEELGLKYRTEFSDAGWVYRFIVSKDSDNMNILESLKLA